MSDEATTAGTNKHHTIWTIGHGDRDFDAVAADLASHGVQTIVDVRSQPYSKHAPDFTKGELEIAAATAGFGYRWLGDRLGGLPLPNSERLDSGLSEIAGLSATSQVVLLCAEEDPLRCHRSTFLTPALVGQGFHIVHIMRDGSAAPHQESLLES